MTTQREPVVSVVIPTYGHEAFVQATLESVWAQTFTDYEIIVINDGSPDGTDALLKPFAAAGRIRYVRQPNGGQASARNQGITQARGEFIALLDDDDLWLPDKLSWQVEALRSHPESAVVYGRATPIDDTGNETVPLGEDGVPLVLPWETPSGWVYEAFIQQNWILSPGKCLIRRTALDAVADPAPFDPDPELRGCDDWDLWCRIAERHPFLFVDRVALRYRFHAANASRDILQMHRGTLRMCQKQERMTRKSGNHHALAIAAFKKARAWSAHELMSRAHILYVQSGAQKDALPARSALRLLRFVAATQPGHLLDRRFLGLFLRLHRNSLRFSDRKPSSLPNIARSLSKD